MSDGTRCVLIVSWPDRLAAALFGFLACLPTATRKHRGYSLEFEIGRLPVRRNEHVANGSEFY